mmetsp:Transcript_21568/g.27439  ORF Transcript_21568/g.27439 Transcript_21568/m.27439 type:complete len:91 (+) Transcript_21568:38-310(+)|eukprot:CAMPEP_0206201142 /NCGR_PEP_ID=MMETSP0166-20121206/11337_1 /ASSEMBLY_ACC=CAM_ASM_000260 /TAXON_ID=95228 /ORGANISM="Vannella robusta, Strain DIVA3 518/3/11/1/6" /LENGTH=90 /DNA_ID=CAMNT_0053619691 /DNA_START=12 /DNA_END=284 /DNA_ORIENTATION=-
MASASNNPWKQNEVKTGVAKPTAAAGARGKAAAFEQMGQPEPKPKIIKGKTSWGDTGHSGGHANQGKFQKTQVKPKKSDFGPAPSLNDLP